MMTNEKNIHYNKRHNSFQVALTRNKRTLTRSFKNIDQAIKWRDDVLNELKQNDVVMIPVRSGYVIWTVSLRQMDWVRDSRSRRRKRMREKFYKNLANHD